MRPCILSVVENVHFDVQTLNSMNEWLEANHLEQTVCRVLTEFHIYQVLPVCNDNVKT